MRLRPVRMEDAAFIVWLRNSDHAKGKLGDSAATAEGQKSWLQTYSDRTGDYYFIVETTGGVSVGTIGIYDHAAASAEFGRFIIAPGVQAALSAMVLCCNLAFERLALSELRATSVGTNVKLHSFIRKLGFQQTSIDRAERRIKGEMVDIFNFSLTANDWLEQRDSFVPLADYAGRRISEWETRTQNQIQYGSKRM